MDWESSYGFTNVKDVQFNTDSLLKTSRYVSKYCSKGVFENPKVSVKLVEPSFRISSKGLGSCYVDKMKSFHLADKTDLHQMLIKKRVVLPDNKAYPMPRYYKNKIYGTKNLLSFKLFCLSEKGSDDLYNKKLASLQALHPDWKAIQAVRFLYIQDFNDKEYKRYNLYRQIGSFYSRSKL